MKITKQRLKQLIKEELKGMLNEGPLEDYIQGEEGQADWQKFISGEGMFAGPIGKVIAKGQIAASWDVEEFRDLYLTASWKAGMGGEQDPGAVGERAVHDKLMEILLGGTAVGDRDTNQDGDVQWDELVAKGDN